tara:strand:- start:158 stop:721 length:564 start_codon:yes stop_codon:yes gene_type:complete
MRIISGQYKGKKILEPLDKNTRPLKDLTKESVFNIIKHSNKLNFNLNNSNILDLFSGVGSFGLEALSRNANFVTFVENYLSVVKILKENIKNLNLNQKTKIIEKDILSNFNLAELNQKYDLIFIDPPFREKKIKHLILNIYKSEILSSNGIIIIHRNRKGDDVFPIELNILEKKTYGVSQIFFCNFV